MLVWITPEAALALLDHLMTLLSGAAVLIVWRRK